MLALKNVEVIYDDVILVLKGLSLEVPDGKIIALLGPNGAGKSTTLKAISGLLHAEEGEVTDGQIELDGKRIEHHAPEEIVRRGIFQVMEGRRVFEDLTVDENIVVGGYTRSDRAALEARNAGGVANVMMPAVESINVVVRRPPRCPGQPGR